MMNLKESQTVEFKQIWKDEYLKTLCAFANSEGDVLYIGICDNYQIVGGRKDGYWEVLDDK